MIIEKTTVGVQYIPIMKNGRQVDFIQIMGGMNEVDDKKWALVHESLKGHINSKKIIIHNAEVTEESTKEKRIVIEGKEKVEKEVTVKTHKIKAKKFVQLPADEALVIVANTFDIKTLKAWNKKGCKDVVRAAIAEQIKKIEEHKIKKKDGESEKADKEDDK